MSVSSGRDYLVSPFAIQRPKSSVACRDTLRLSASSSFGDPNSDDTQRPMWSSAPFREMSASSSRDYLVSPVAMQQPESLVACVDTLRLSEPSSFGDPKLDDTQRPMCSSTPFPVMLVSFGRDYFHLTFCYPVTQESGGMRRHLTVIRTS